MRTYPLPEPLDPRLEGMVRELLAGPDAATQGILADYLQEGGADPVLAELLRREDVTALPVLGHPGGSPPQLALLGWRPHGQGQDAYGPWVGLRIGEAEQRLRWVPPGRFWMGSPADEEGRFDGEGPRHEVTLSEGFWLFETPVTQALWQAVMGTNPSHFKGPSRPVETVGWEDCQAFAAKVQERVPGLVLGLPSEAQWEYACRAGTEGARHGGLDAVAWYRENSGMETHPVGRKEANGWGLFDMLGNVWEWCHDGMREYTEEPVTDPLGPTEAGADRALRGGGCWVVPRLVRAAHRLALLPGLRRLNIGFRCSSSGREPEKSGQGDAE